MLPDPTYPNELVTVGNRIRKHRLDLGRTQAETAGELGVCTHTVRNWESGQTAPGVRHWRALIRFLGYDPHPAPRTLGERVSGARRVLGMTYRELASVLGVPADTIRGWEVDGCMPRERTRKQVEVFLKTVPRVRYRRG